MTNEHEMTIGEACELAGFAPSALRFYQELSLLEPDRVDALTGYRYYRADRLLFLNFLRSMKQRGIPLARLRGLVPLPETAPLLTVFQQQTETVRAELARLQHELRWLQRSQQSLKSLVEPLEPPQLVEVASQWGWAVDGSYDFRGYARARRSLLERIRRAPGSWIDELTAVFSWPSAAGLDVGRCCYRLEGEGKTRPSQGTEDWPAWQAAVVRVRGPIAGVFEETKRLMTWMGLHSRRPTGRVEWKHLVSTAQTSNPHDFLTEVRIGCESLPDQPR